MQKLKDAGWLVPYEGHSMLTTWILLASIAGIPLWWRVQVPERDKAAIVASAKARTNRAVPSECCGCRAQASVGGYCPMTSFNSILGIGTHVEDPTYKKLFSGTWVHPNLEEVA